jgi:ADP-dependent glucokinase
VLAGERHERLGEVRATLAALPKKTRVHFEMASFAEEDCLNDVISNIVRFSDSLGMNEQELPNLHSLLTNGSVTLVSDPYPRIATTLDHMRAVYGLLQGVDADAGERPLTRLHVHTLAYQAIMTTKGSSWKHSMSAAAKSSLVANRHTCGSAEIDAAKARLLMDDSFSTSREAGGDEGRRRIPLDPRRPVACWGERVAGTDVEICIAPVLVCTDVVQTGGGGDNISSAGLVLQI